MSKLYLVPTPIGNLGDITFRAVEVLKEADLLLAEDTRKSAILLKHLEISKPVHSHHKFNEHRSVETLVQRMQGGSTMALITDAGTPGISDPGFLLVRACIEHGIPVETLPGPTAFVPALVDSGLPCERFVFEGFLPQKKGDHGILRIPLQAGQNTDAAGRILRTGTAGFGFQGTDQGIRGNKAGFPDRAF